MDPTNWRERPPPDGVEFREVLSDDDLDAFHRLTTAYWELPEEDARLVGRIQREWGPGRAPGHRYLALLDGEVVAKGYLSLAGPLGVAAIYAMTTIPPARGKGIASGLTGALLARARGLGCASVVLHATDMAVNMYRRVGFEERYTFNVYATAPLWSHAR